MFTIHVMVLWDLYLLYQDNVIYIEQVIFYKIMLVWYFDHVNGPTPAPTNQPTARLTDRPTERPTGQPTPAPTNQPTDGPTRAPSDAPTFSPTGNHTPGVIL